MVNNKNGNKSPDDFLKEIQRAKLGRLRLYVGFAAGVGKTHKMLQEAHRLQDEGIDVVIGVAETHEREETEKLLEGLEIIPKKEMNYKGYTLKEMDLEKVIERDPEVVVVDELPHINIPPAKNEHRYMDVEEIIEAGINVMSAMNIQHLQSLNDIVEDITGITVNGQVPDRILDKAQEVILIDITPEKLRERLREGKLYKKEEIDKALNNFFNKSNLSALRELSLREIADNTFKRREEPDVNIQDKVLICIQKEKSAGRLIRRGGKLANRLQTNFLVLHILPKKEKELNKEYKDKIERWKEIVNGFNDGELILKQTKGRSISETIADVAKENNITHIILGETQKPKWVEIFKGSIVDNIMRNTTGIDIHIVAAKDE